MKRRTRAVVVRQRLVQLCAVSVICAVAAPSLAATRFWDNHSGGSFTFQFNWQSCGFFCNPVPDSNDRAVFDLSDISSFFQFAYTVNFSTDKTIESLGIGDDFVTFDLNGHTLTTVTAGGTTAISGDDGRSGALTITDGTVHVQNSPLLVSQLGALGGDGQIVGNVDNFGTVAPGNSLGTLHINGDYTQRNGGTMQVEIGGTTPGSQFDTLDITGRATLDGTLSVSLLNGFTPASGTVFEIIHADLGISGFFDNLSFPPGPAWAFVDTGFSLFLIAPGPALPGDFNANGVVDAADYVLWRNGGPLANDTTPGVQPSDYNVWRAHFGQTVSVGSSSTFPPPPSPLINAVPEPASLLLLFVASLSTFVTRLGR